MGQENREVPLHSGARYGSDEPDHSAPDWLLLRNLLFHDFKSVCD